VISWRGRVADYYNWLKSRALEEAVRPCVLYAAKSTEDRRGSIAGQLNDCRVAVEGHPEQRIVVAEYVDEAFSAYKRNRGPGLVDALEHAEDLAREHGGAELWAQHSDRLARGDGRSARHAVEIALWALKHDVTVRTVQDPDTFRDLLYAVVTGQRNHEDSRRKGLAMTAGRRRAATRGEFIGHLPDGYRLTVKLDRNGRVRKRMVIDDRRREIIRTIFKLALRGRTSGQIARKLNDAGWHTNPRRTDMAPKKWTMDAVRGILTNPRYAGLAVYHGETVARGHWPAYITERQHNKIVARITATRRTNKKPLRLETYLLASLLRCGHCGAPIYCVSGKQLSDHSHQRRYVCASQERGRYKGSCNTPRVPADMLEAMLVASLRPLLLDQPDPQQDGVVQPANVYDLSRERHELRQASLTGDHAAFTHALDGLLARIGPHPSISDHESLTQRQARQLETIRQFEAWAAAEFIKRTETTRAQALKLNKLLISWFATIVLTVSDDTIGLAATRRFPAGAPPSQRQAVVRVDRADWTRVAFHINRPRTRSGSWTDAEIIGALRAWSEAHGHAPTPGDWTTCDTNRPNTRTVQRHFRTWRGALRRADLQPHTSGTPPRTTPWADREIIRALNRWTHEYGHPPKRSDWLWATPGRPNNETVLRHFGSWGGAIHAAGLDAV
jgi:DNA invertase Pin-like site-specific DNA recombinase